MKRFNKKAILSALIGSSLVCSISFCNAMECYEEKDDKKGSGNVTFLYGGNSYKNGFDFEYRTETLKNAIGMSDLLSASPIKNTIEFVSTSKEEMERRLKNAEENVKEGKEVYVFYRDNHEILKGYMCLMQDPVYHSCWCVKEACTYADEPERQKAANELITALKRDLCPLLGDNAKQLSYNWDNVMNDCYINDAWQKNFNSRKIWNWNVYKG